MPPRRPPKPSDTATNDTTNNDEDRPIDHPQSFVKQHFQPGEYDPSGTNPLHRPPWKNRSRIISAEDFNARPTVSFDEEFDSMHDAMVTLTWLSEDERQGIYTAYLNLMIEASNAKDGDAAAGKTTKHNNGPTTSHEYIMQVIAQRYNLSSVRVAAIVQNCHDEEQAAKRGDYIHTKAQEFVDAKVREHITNCYAAYGEIDPMGFVEDPVGVVPGITNPELSTMETVRVEDLWDVESLFEEAVTRDVGEAQRMVDGKIYVEDVDLTDVDSNVNAECLKLIERKNDDFKAKFMGASFQRNEAKGELPLPYNGIPKNQGDVQRRSRWKYAAKIINTREEKKNMAKQGRMSRKKIKKKVNEERLKNIIVEQDGKLRVASVDEVAGTALKPVRNEIEFIYKGVKQAWMDRQLRNEKGGWGRVPPAPPKEVIVKGAKTDEEIEGGTEEEMDQNDMEAVEDGNSENKK